ncbi:hypothetical protein PVAP13_7KG167185 [Panicum virgatum]|uniref:Uncharacterized protein n=1 Tax=Panicum virgatum TaxID=38727 RepID=A0A8T0QE97_PANVG|nr:hypothetical protein PVAP13_7KG167185 [Panicum virgatum]
MPCNLISFSLEFSSAPRITTILIGFGFGGPPPSQSPSHGNLKAQVVPLGRHPHPDGPPAAIPVLEAPEGEVAAGIPHPSSGRGQRPRAVVPVAIKRWHPAAGSQVGLLPAPVAGGQAAPASAGGLARARRAAGLVAVAHRRPAARSRAGLPVPAAGHE